MLRVGTSLAADYSIDTLRVNNNKNTKMENNEIAPIYRYRLFAIAVAVRLGGSEKGIESKQTRESVLRVNIVHQAVCPRP